IDLQPMQLPALAVALPFGLEPTVNGERLVARSHRLRERAADRGVCAIARHLLDGAGRALDRQLALERLEKAANAVLARRHDLATVGEVAIDREQLRDPVAVHRLDQLVVVVHRRDQRSAIIAAGWRRLRARADEQQQADSSEVWHGWHAPSYTP